MDIRLMSFVEANVCGVGCVVHSLADGFDHAKEGVALLDLFLEAFSLFRELRIDELFLLRNKSNEFVCLGFELLKLFQLLFKGQWLLVFT